MGHISSGCLRTSASVLVVSEFPLEEMLQIHSRGKSSDGPSKRLFWVWALEDEWKRLPEGWRHVQFPNHYHFEKQQGMEKNGAWFISLNVGIQFWLRCPWLPWTLQGPGRSYCRVYKRPETIGSHSLRPAGFARVCQIGETPLFRQLNQDHRNNINRS